MRCVSPYCWELATSNTTTIKLFKPSSKHLHCHSLVGGLGPTQLWAFIGQTKKNRVPRSLFWIGRFLVALKSIKVKYRTPFHSLTPGEAMLGSRMQTLPLF